MSSRCEYKGARDYFNFHIFGISSHKSSKERTSKGFIKFYMLDSAVYLILQPLSLLVDFVFEFS